MKLGTKGLIWASAIMSVVAINSYLTIFSVSELRLTDRLTAQDFETALNIRHVRSQAVDFYVYGLGAGREDATLGDRRKFLQAREGLRLQIAEMKREIGKSGLAIELESVLGDAESLLSFDPRVNGGARSVSFFNPVFRQRLEKILSGLDALADRSAAIVSADRRRNEQLANQLTISSIVMFMLASLITLGRLIFLQRTILLPIQSLADTLRKVRHGDLSVRWQSDRRDEIGSVGQTVNETLAELEQRRAERIQLIGAIVHDLKNPLAAIGLSCDLVLKTGDTTREKALDILKRVRGQIDRLRRMTDDLLSAASTLSPRFELQTGVVDLEGLTSEVLELFRDAHPERRYSLIREHEVPASIPGDRDRLAQVMTNLVSNATKYSPPESEIEVVLSAAPRSVILEVRDRGIGIPREKVDSIFQPFTRLESGREMSTGIGLGLATVRSIVLAHSGNVSVHSRLGGGTIMRVELPVATVPARVA
jgi:signal transduction histidine kinase